MGLSKEQLASYVKQTRVALGPPVTVMSDGAIVALVCRTARDLVESNALQAVPHDLITLASYASELPDLYAASSASAFELPVFEPPIVVFERLVASGVNDLDTYFYSLAELHKRRLRYENILSAQAFPRIEQVGPRAMLQYGNADPAALAVLLTWRKWIYDIDNRAAQETGYVFEPALVGALGGASFPSGRSPIRRLNDPRKGRQVDCLLETPEGKWAYEFKIRVTIAASGQGRFPEELSFPQEANAAGFVPILVVFDGTQNARLTQLRRAYEAAGGSAYIGDSAWEHIEERSGSVMALFVEKYLRGPLTSLLQHEPDRDALPSIEFSMLNRQIMISIEGWEPMEIARDLGRATLATDMEEFLE